MNDAWDRTPRWAEMDHHERELAYTPSSMVPEGLDPYLHRYADESRSAYCLIGSPNPILPLSSDPLAEMGITPTPRFDTIVYGERRSNTMDLVVPARTDDGGQRWPLLVFIHGGYWQALSKRDGFFPAPACLARGWAFASLDYTLAPHASIDQIVDECVTALAALARRADRFRVDADRIVVAGSSAGAHLAAMASLRLAAGLRPAGLVLLSGIYELESLLDTSINEAVGMDRASARRNSPALFPQDPMPPTVVAWAERDTDEFKAQSRAYADALRAAAVPVTEVERPDRNHFDVVFDLVPDLLDCLPVRPAPDDGVQADGV